LDVVADAHLRNMPELHPGSLQVVKKFVIASI
jgi:hypothetical protein